MRLRNCTFYCSSLETLRWFWSMFDTFKITQIASFLQKIEQNLSKKLNKLRGCFSVASYRWFPFFFICIRLCGTNKVYLNHGRFRLRGVRTATWISSPFLEMAKSFDKISLLNPNLEGKTNKKHLNLAFSRKVHVFFLNFKSTYIGLCRLGRVPCAALRCRSARANNEMLNSRQG